MKTFLKVVKWTFLIVGGVSMILLAVGIALMSIVSEDDLDSDRYDYE